jgi:hypothetical protein
MLAGAGWSTAGVNTSARECGPSPAILNRRSSPSLQTVSETRLDRCFVADTVFSHFDSASQAGRPAEPSSASYRFGFHSIPQVHDIPPVWQKRILVANRVDIRRKGHVRDLAVLYERNLVDECSHQVESAPT